MRVFQAEIALLLVSAACMGCSSSRVTDEEVKRSDSDYVPVPPGWTPIQLGLVRAAQLFPYMCNVYGVRINVLDGRNSIVNGLDLGAVVNQSDASHGLQGGFVNYVETEGWGLQAAFANFIGQGHVDDGYSGLQVAGFSNSGSADGIQIAGYLNGSLKGWGIPGDIRGLQIAGVFNIAKSVAGVQVAAINASFQGFSGLQVGGGNLANRGAGVQVGAINASFEGFSGLQVGGLNSTDIAGFCVQVGVINMVEGGSGVQFGLWNSNPNGFLPYFPILNFSF